MKLSLSWIFEHLGLDIKDLKEDQNKCELLMKKFNDTVAEIDEFKKVSFDLGFLFLAKVVSNSGNLVVFHCPELDKEISVEIESEASFDIGTNLLLRKENDKFYLARMSDFCAENDGALPPLYCEKALLSGGWRRLCDKEDFLLVIDNKSITNRPDLWGHRGVAREFGAVMGVPVKDESEFIKEREVEKFSREFEANTSNHAPLGIEIEKDIFEKKICGRYAGIYFKNLENRPSDIFMAQRLARIDARPISALVDISNYVMFDFGQPNHVFDADIISKKLIIKKGETEKKLDLIDGTDVNLTEEDCVIADTDKDLALGGIIGGLQSGITPETKNMFLESASFDPFAIRKSSMAHKKRTEASIRFEKGPDPGQNIPGIKRFLFLLELYGIKYEQVSNIISVGQEFEESRMIELEHDFLEDKIGISIDVDRVVDIFQTLNFGVACKFKGDPKSGSDICQKDYYKVLVPSYRQDLRIREDLVEEVSRVIGYNLIPQDLPLLKLDPVENSRVLNIRAIKRQCAFGLSMNEISTYNLFDESFLREIDWYPDKEEKLQLKNPISENLSRLLTTLVPNLLKALQTNALDYQSFGFFELSPVWCESNGQVEEKNSLALVWYDSKGRLDFYEKKSELESIFDLFGVKVNWGKLGVKRENWHHSSQSAELSFEGKKIGRVGKVNPSFLKKLAKGDAFVAEIDVDFLILRKRPVLEAKPLPKYQKVKLDFSLMAPLNLTVSEIEKSVAPVDEKIIDVFLADFYLNPDWKDKRALTLRCTIYDCQGTMNKAEIKRIEETISGKLTSLGAVLR